MPWLLRNMAPSIGLNLRVTGYKHQGGRKYMEDEFGVAYQQTADEKDLEYAFFGIFDGHGGGKQNFSTIQINLHFHIWYSRNLGNFVGLITKCEN